MEPLPGMGAPLGCISAYSFSSISFLPFSSCLALTLRRECVGRKGWKDEPVFSEDIAISVDGAADERRGNDGAAQEGREGGEGVHGSCS